MGWLESLFDKLTAGPKTSEGSREAKAKEHFGGSNSVFYKPNPGDTSQYWEQAANRKPTPKPTPKPGLTQQQQRERDAALSGNFSNVVTSRPNAMGTPTKEQEKAAALSGNFGTVTGPTQQAAPVNNGAWGPYTPTERPPDAVLQGLNELGFKVAVPEKSAGMPSSSFSSTKELPEHQYRVSPIEDEYLRTAFNQPMAIVGGPEAGGGVIRPPAVPVDQALPLMSSGPVESAALTWEAYEDLTDQQKAAVDWNTLLVDAREKDYSDKYTTIPSAAERAEYDAEVTRLFGEHGGSNRYAPHIVDLLSQLDVVQLGQDLDEYLSLERAIDDTQLKDFTFSKQDVATLNNLAGGDQDLRQSYAQVRSGDNAAALNTALVQGTTGMIEEKLASPDSIPTDFETLMYGLPENGTTPLGYGTGDVDQEFQKGLAALMAPDPTVAGVPADADPMAFVLDNLAIQGADEEMQNAFLEYVGQVSHMLGQYGSEEEKTMAALMSKRSGLGG